MERLFGSKRRPPLCLSLFASLQRPFLAVGKCRKLPEKAPTRVFVNPDEHVGLGIAAMPDKEPGPNPPVKRVFRNPIIPKASKKRTAAEVDPLSESYTCVTTRRGNSMVTKRVYFEDDLVEADEDGGGGEIFVPVTKSARETEWEGGYGLGSAYFLSKCRLCKKKLQGLDIYMYKGYEAFCSPECREEFMEDDSCEDLLGP